MQAKRVFNSRVLNGGGLIHRERLEISGEYVRYKKHSWFKHDNHSITIALKNIIAMEIFPRVHGVNVILKTNERTISCRGLTRKRANEIKRLIENKA